MRLKHWRQFIGKKITLRLPVRTPLNVIDKLGVGTVVGTECFLFPPMLVLKDFRLLNMGKYYSHVRDKEKIDTLHTAELGFTHNLFGPSRYKSFKANKASLIEINGIKLSHLFGINIANWPLSVLITHFLKNMWDNAHEDPKMRTKIRRSWQEIDVFFKCIQLCRAIPPKFNYTSPNTKYLAQLFKI